MKETAAFLRVNPDTVYAWIKRGLIKTQKVVIEKRGHLREKTLIIKQSVRDACRNINQGDNDNER